MTKYYVLSMDNDGEINLGVFEKQELTIKLNQGHWGENIKILKETDLKKGLAYVFGLFIIRGDSVDPKPVKSTIEWEID